MFGDSDARRDDLDQDEAVEVPVDGPDDVTGAADGSSQDATHWETESEHFAAPVPPVTGDTAVDEAMVQLARSQAGSFAERIESGEHAHRSLQSRLGGLGGA